MFKKIALLHCTLIFVVFISVLRDVVWTERGNAQTGKLSEVTFI
jgi:hypothetical protein